MGSKLYVGNLSYETGEDELKLAFTQCGTVAEVKIVLDRETNRSRGFGFVRMATDEEAQAAIKRWSGERLDGRPLTVNEAVDKPRGDGRQSPPRQQFSGPGGYSNGTYVSDSPPERRRERGHRSPPRGHFD